MRISLFSIIVLVLTSRLGKFETTGDYDEQSNYNYNYTADIKKSYNFKPEISIQEEEGDESAAINEEEEYDAYTASQEEEQESSHKYQLPNQERHEEARKDITSIGEGSLVVRGEYSFNAGGQIYKVSYVADSNGYRARIQQVKEVGESPTTVSSFLGIPTTVPGIFTTVPPRPKINKDAIESIGGGRSGK